jgi:hypothetical protein
MRKRKSTMLPKGGVEHGRHGGAQTHNLKNKVNYNRGANLGKYLHPKKKGK